MSARESIAVLCPRGGNAEARRLRRGVAPVLAGVIQAAATTRSADELLLEVYLAGLWHGSELIRQRAGLTAEQIVKLEPEA